MKKTILSLLAIPMLLSANVESGPFPNTYTVNEWGSDFSKDRSQNMRPSKNEMEGSSSNRGGRFMTSVTKRLQND